MVEQTMLDLQEELEKWIRDWHDTNDFGWWMVEDAPRLAAVAACAVIEAAAAGYQESQDAD